jgi:hypothetical protein
MFTEWLVEAHYLRMFLQISRIPHFTTLQKFSDRIVGTILQEMISYFIALINVNHIFFGIDSSGFKSTHSSQYYAERAKLSKKKWRKLSVGADVLQQIICSIKTRRALRARYDNIDFRPIITRTSEIKPISVVVADKGYDREENYVLVREYMKACSIIPPRNMHVPIWKTHGRYRKQMKRGYTNYCTISVTRMKR